MKDYFLTLTCAGIFCGIIGFIFDSHENDGTARAVKTVCSLCIVCVIILPIVRLFGHGNKIDVKNPFENTHGFTDYADIQREYDKYVIEKARLSLCDEVAQRIYEKFGIFPDKTDIQFSVSEKDGKSEVSIASAELTVSESKDGLSDYVFELLGIVPKIRITRG